MVAPRESADLARHLIEATARKHGIDEGTLTLHADRGSSMTSKTLAELLIDLGVAKSHSRPRTGNDNPHVEASFKTLKYCPRLPARFGSIEHARTFCQEFYTWYNRDHFHSGIGYHHPIDVHYGCAAAVLTAAHARHPERFASGGLPTPPDLPGPAWIDKPKTDEPKDATEKTTRNQPSSTAAEPTWDSMPGDGPLHPGVRDLGGAGWPRDTTTACERSCSR